MKQWITAQEAAIELGLSSSTFKRFCDSHSIPFVRTPGGHRRIDRSQLNIASQLLRTRSRADAVPEINLHSVLQLLKDGSSDPLFDLLVGSAGTPQRMVTILEDYFVPAMWMLGDMCFNGTVEIALEKICTATASRVLAAVTMWMPRVDASRIFVGATFPPHTDTIASKIVSIGLKSIGVKPLDLGPGISPEYIAKAAILCGAEGVWISHTHVNDQMRFVENHRALRDALPAGFRVIIGGGGLSPSLRRLVPDCIYYETVTMMLQGEASPSLVQ